MLSAVKPVTASSKVMVTVTWRLFFVTRLVVDVVGDEGGCVAEHARVARDIAEAGHVDPDLQALHVGVWRQVHRGPQIAPPSRAVVGGAQVLQRAPARRYRQVIRCEGGLIYPLVEGKGDGGYLVGAGLVGGIDRVGAEESGPLGVTVEGVAEYLLGLITAPVAVSKGGGDFVADSVAGDLCFPVGDEGGTPLAFTARVPPIVPDVAIGLISLYPHSVFALGIDGNVECEADFHCFADCQRAVVNQSDAVSQGHGALFRQESG